MLSVRRRQEDARGVGARGAAAGGMEDDAELEEGEACGDDTAFLDPDVALSYIDEKLQDVLGHFQKDFEGGVSAETLGSKFGGYGSFLPTYQRSPLPQTRSPPKVANLSSRSPYHQSTEGMSQNPSAVAVPSISQNNGSVVPFSGNSSKREHCQSTKAEKGSITHDSFGLGLDISSPSSMEDSPFFLQLYLERCFEATLGVLVGGQGRLRINERHPRAGDGVVPVGVGNEDLQLTISRWNTKLHVSRAACRYSLWIQVRHLVSWMLYV